MPHSCIARCCHPGARVSRLRDGPGRTPRRAALTCDHLVTYCAGVDDVFKALADPTRRSLLDELFRQDGQTLSALEGRFAMSRFGVMKHLHRWRRRAWWSPGAGAGRSSTS